ncbi:MAG: translation initiation factor IF-2 N-terminal domain-containing protein, partial [Oscillospiraceae bacterium]|nr:translation initiation factor IF-2 N-terminal domain-containing protein [Oscillospiraceae bacterium]
MAIEFKYRIHEVAKDFGLTSKVIGQILTDYATAPKNHMQVLEENELDLIFEYLTQHNQVGSIAEIFAPDPEEIKRRETPAPAAEPAKADAAPAKPQGAPAAA